MGIQSKTNTKLNCRSRSCSGSFSLVCLLNTRLHSIQPKTHSEVLIGDTTTTTLSSTTMQRTAGNRPLLSGALCSEKQEEVLIKPHPGKTRRTSLLQHAIWNEQKNPKLIQCLTAKA